MKGKGVFGTGIVDNPKWIDKDERERERGESFRILDSVFSLNEMISLVGTREAAEESAADLAGL